MSQLMLYWNLLLFMSKDILMYAQPSSGERDLILGRMLHLFPQFVHASSEGYGETAGVHRLARQ